MRPDKFYYTKIITLDVETEHESPWIQGDSWIMINIYDYSDVSQENAYIQMDLDFFSHHYPVAHKFPVVKTLELFSRVMAHCNCIDGDV